MSTYREDRLNKLDSNLRPLCDKDKKWNQIMDEESRQSEEYNRLKEEKDELETTLTNTLTEDDRKRKQQDLKIVTAKRNIAWSKMWVAVYQRYQRECELEKSLLEDGDPQLADIEAQIKEYQVVERDREKAASQYQTELDKLMSEKNKDEAPSGHILTREELYILRRLLADYSDSKLKEISRRFEENQDGDIVREEVESALREEGLTSIADDLKENLEKGVENQKHYEAYESALRGGLSLIMRYLKIVLFGPPRSGKSSTLRRLLQEIENLSKDGELSVSTGVAETNDVIIKKLTSETAALPQWRSMKRSKEGGRLEEGDVDDLTQLFFRLISKYTSESKQSADTEATATKKSQHPQNRPDSVSINFGAELKAEVSSVTLSEAEETEIDKAFKKLTAVLRKDSPDDLKQLLEALTLANMMDVGGQPAFLDVLPTLTIGPALYMLFFRLDQDLKKHHTVHFCPADSKEEIQLQDTYRIDEVMCQALSSIVCFSRQPSQESAESASRESAGSASTHAVIFGTFKDKSTDAEISEKEKTIQDKLMSTKLHKEGLLLKTQKGKAFFTVDNMFGTDQSEMAEIRKNIEDIITSKFCALPIPASWLMFRMLLHLLGKPVVSLALCEEIAIRLSMTTPVREAIWFFHHNIGSLMHYPDIPSMKEVVICNPQVIFDSISKLIINKFQYSNYKLDQSVIEGFLLKGQFTLSDIDDKTEDQRSDLLSPKQLVDLLKDRNVLAETKDNQEEARPSEPKFVMPTVLKYASEEELKLPTSTSSKQEAPPLMIHFESGFVPFGVFCASVANLIARQDSLSPRWQLCGDQVMKNKVKFCIAKSVYATLISRPQYLEIRVERHPRARSKLSFPTICSAVRETIVQTLESIIRNIKYRPFAKIKTLVFPTHHPFDLAFTCCLEESHRDHLMQVVKDEGEYYGECLKESTVIGVDLEEKHLIWFSQTEQTTTTSHKQPASTASGVSSFQHNAPQKTASSLDQPASTLTQQHTTYGVLEQMVPTLTPSSLAPSASTHLPHIPEMTVCVSTLKTEDLSRLSTASPTTQLTSHSSTTSAPLVPYISDSASISSTTVSYPSPSFATASKSSPSQSPVSGVYSNSSPSSGHDNSSRLSPRTVSKFSPCSDSDKIVIPPLPESMKSHSTPSSDNQECASIPASTSAQIPMAAAASNSHLSPPIKSSASRVNSPATGSVSVVALEGKTVHSTPSSDLEGKESASISAERSTLLSKDSLGTGDLANILQAVWKARVEWYNIGLALHISSDTLDVIKSENHHVVKDCFREMLKEWLKSEPPPTWTELVEALKSPIVEYEELAEAITHRPF